MKTRSWILVIAGITLGALFIAVVALWLRAAYGYTLAGAIMAFLVFIAALYIYVALALSTIAKKTHTEDAWLAWIPIANIVLMLHVAKKPVWWIIFIVIPVLNIVGIVFAVLIWMAIAKARGKPIWWGILVIVPVVNLIVPGYLAWAD